MGRYSKEFRERAVRLTTEAMDLRFDAPLAEMNVCDRLPAKGGSGPDVRLLVPGNSAVSLLLSRALSDVPGERMPPAGSIIPDTEGLQVLAAWIDSLSDCP